MNRFVTILAAVVAVLGLGFEPFVQQSVKYPLRQQAIPSRKPPIPTVQTVTSSSGNLTVLANAAILQALYSDAVTPLEPACTGFGCDWPPYKSVAFCHSCEDALDDIIIEPKQDAALQAYHENDYLSGFDIQDVQFYNRSYVSASNIEATLSRPAKTSYNISLGVGATVGFELTTTNNLVIDHSITSSQNGSTLNYPETIVWDLNEGSYCYRAINPATDTCLQWSNTSINGVKGPLRAFGYLKLAHVGDVDRLIATTAQKCILTLCAQQYSTAIHNGSLSSNVTSQDYGFFSSGLTMEFDAPAPLSGEYKTMQWNASLNGSRFAAVWSSGDNNVLPDFSTALSNLQGTVTRYFSSGYPLDPRYFSSSNGTFNAGPDLMRLTSNIQNSTAKIAQGLTNFIQLNGDVAVRGRTFESVPFVEVRWAWLTFPLALVAIALAALLATMYQTRRCHLPLWRSSPFPLMFNYHDRDACVASDVGAGEVDFPQAVTTSRHEEMAREIQLRLRSRAGLWTFEKHD